MRDRARTIVPRFVRDGLRTPSATLRWSYLSFLGSLGVTIPLSIRPGWTFPCHPVARHFGYQTLTKQNDEKAEFDLFVAHCSVGMVFIDVGAHFGLFSLAALHYGGTESKVVAVEPSPGARTILRKQIRIMAAQDRAQIFAGCISNHDGAEHFVSTGYGASRQFVPPREHPRSEWTNVPSLTIDSLAEHYSIEPTHIKIDVEGGEFLVLDGARRVMAENSPLLFIELHNDLVRERGGNPATTLALLNDAKYSIVASGVPFTNDIELLQYPIVRVVAGKN